MEVAEEVAEEAGEADEAKPEVVAVGEEVAEEVAKEVGDGSVQSGVYEPLYCCMPCKDGHPCQFEISVKPCPLHVKSALTDQHAREPEYCNKPRKDGKRCQWNVSIRPCAKHANSEPTAEDRAEEAARLALPTCPMVKRSGVICGLRGCGFHAPPDQRCASMIDSDVTLRCFRFKEVGEFCLSQGAFPDLSVNMVKELNLTAGNKITEEGFIAKYYPGTDKKSFGFEFKAYVKSMRARVH